MAVEETGLQRQQGLAWQAVHRGRDWPGGRRLRRWSERRPLTVADARDRVIAWFRSWRDRPAKPKAPALRADQFLGARVRILAPCVAGGAGRPAGWVGIVPDSEVEILTSNDRAVVLERRIVCDRETGTVPARATRNTQVNGRSVAAGDDVLVDAATSPPRSAPGG